MFWPLSSTTQEAGPEMSSEATLAITSTRRLIASELVRGPHWSAPLSRAPQAPSLNHSSLFLLGLKAHAQSVAGRPMDVHPRKSDFRTRAAILRDRHSAREYQRQAIECHHLPASRMFSGTGRDTQEEGIPESSVAIHTATHRERQKPHGLLQTSMAEGRSLACLLGSVLGLRSILISMRPSR